LPPQVPRRNVVVDATRPLRTIDTRAPFDYVQVYLQNALLAEDDFSHWYERDLRTLTKDRAAGSEKQILYELLREGGCSTSALAFHILSRSDFNLVPIEPVMLVEARVLGGDYGVLEIRRDLAERKELIVFLIWPVMNPGLQSALDLHHGGRWVDPAGYNQQQRGNRPKGQRSDDKPSKNGSERDVRKLNLGKRARP